MKVTRNIRMIEVVAQGLGELRDSVVFIGGATTALYIDDPNSPEPTPSDDVDLVVEVASSYEYGEFEKALRSKGFKDPLPDPDVQHPICRKMYRDIQVDIMPNAEVKLFIFDAFKALLNDDLLLEEASLGFLNAGGDPIKRARKLVSRVEKLIEQRT